MRWSPHGFQTLADLEEDVARKARVRSHTRMVNGRPVPVDEYDRDDPDWRPPVMGADFSGKPSDIWPLGQQGPEWHYLSGVLSWGGVRGEPRAVPAPSGRGKDILWQGASHSVRMTRGGFIVTGRGLPRPLGARTIYGLATILARYANPTGPQPGWSVRT
jgi:hypothetical protein